MRTKWQASAASEAVFEGRDHATGEVKWTGTRVDLLFVRTPSSEHRGSLCMRRLEGGVCEGLSCWVEQVMNLDRYDLADAGGKEGCHFVRHLLFGSAQTEVRRFS